jgi:predicted glutamine amidotransferase
MCRIFGFRSIIESQVHQSLIQADNALLNQSKVHSDGWGVAYYKGGIPHLIKSSKSAWSDRLFRQLSGILSSYTVVAHLRKATIGPVNNINTHPFQYGRWVFVHNGNLRNFNLKKKLLYEKIDPELSRFILGETDSECLFFLLLTNLKRQLDPLKGSPRMEFLKSAVQVTLSEIEKIFGPIQKNDGGDPTDQYLTFLLTDGVQLIAHQGGKKLFYSTHKKLCNQRNTCPAYAKTCETYNPKLPVQHLLISSETLHGENVWSELEPGSIVALNEQRKLSITDSSLKGKKTISFSPIS